MSSFDYIIVGGGSAGCVLANRLSASGKHTVALLEAGGTHRSPLVTIPFNLGVVVTSGLKNWRFQTVPQEGLNGRTGYQPRGKALGGSSSINAMLYLRGAKEDYDLWESMGNPGWSYKDVLPYFKRSEDRVRGENEYRAVGGPLSVAPPRSPNPANKIWLKAGQECQLPLNDDFNGASQEGVGYFELTQKRGERHSAAHAYLDPVEKRSNLTIYTEAFAHRVTFEGKRANGVEVKIGGKMETLTANKEVILSCGAFQSPQLLMLSGIGPKSKLEPHGITQIVDLPGVGENLHDHLDFSLIYQSDYKHLLGVNARSIFGVAINQMKYWFQRRGVLTTNFNESGGFAYTDPSEPSPDVQFHFAFVILDNHGRTRHKFGGYTCHVCLLRPKSRGSVDLASADPEAHPLIDPAFLREESDVKNMLAGVKKAQQLLRAPAFDEIRGKPLYATGSDDDEELLEDIRSRADTIYHPVGTCKMGPDSDPNAVVDASLKVKGVEGLRVVDASVMPSIVSGNTNGPTIMVGEKGADLILADA